jgi:3-hydroxybutyryl-CoA dehydrogenase
MTQSRIIGIAGAGTMGRGIAEVTARSGYEVVLMDLDQKILDAAISAISASLAREAARGGMREAEAEQALARIRPTTDIADLASAGFAIEAVREDLETKREVLSRMDRHLPAGVILASNTSSIPITKLASFTGRPGDFLGMHFMNPASLMPLVEIVRGLATSERAVGDTRELAERIGKTAILVSDSPGFVSNRLLMPMINEAVFCVMEGVGSPEAVDQIMKLGMRHPMGPLALADLIGLDVCLEVMEVLHESFADSKYRPCPLLRRMVDGGRLGRKSGIGFYTHP